MLDADSTVSKLQGGEAFADLIRRAWPSTPLSSLPTYLAIDATCSPSEVRCQRLNKPVKLAAAPPSLPQTGHYFASENDASVVELGRCWHKRVQDARLLGVAGGMNMLAALDPPKWRVHVFTGFHIIHDFSPSDLSMKQASTKTSKMLHGLAMRTIPPKTASLPGTRGSTRTDVKLRKQTLTALLKIWRTTAYFRTQPCSQWNQETCQTNAWYNAKRLDMRR